MVLDAGGGRGVDHWEGEDSGLLCDGSLLPGEDYLWDARVGSRLRGGVARGAMALFRKFFYRKPPDGLLEISERVYGMQIDTFLGFFFFSFLMNDAFLEFGEVEQKNMELFVVCDAILRGWGAAFLSSLGWNGCIRVECVFGRQDFILMLCVYVRCVAQFSVNS